ncbi:MAG TPA: hypothetical protein DCM41_01125 [Synergistaceae bacterium]|nr:hypothetical protein [Synergistaceae bacterium]
MLLLFSLKKLTYICFTHNQKFICHYNVKRIQILVKQEQTDIPLFDTTTLLAEAAVKEALNGKS